MCIRDRSRYIHITATPEEYTTLDKVLLDFIQNPLEYDLSEFLSEDDVKDMTHQVEACLLYTSYKLKNLFKLPIQIFF